MKERDLLKKFFIYFKKKKLRKHLCKETSSYTRSKNVSYKNYWKKYDKHYNKVFNNFYFETTGNDSTYFIPDDFYFSEIDMKLNDWFAAEYMDDKTLYENYFPNIKQPETIAKRINNIWFSNNKICNFNDVLKKCLIEKEVVAKLARNSSGGSGVYFLKEQSIKKLNNIKGDIIVQKVISQSPELNKLSSFSINTIRVLTLLIDGDVLPLSSIIRFGVNKSRTDNASSGGLTCGIQENGQLKSVAYKCTGEKYDINPNTNMPFHEITIPNYNQIIDTAKKAHIQFPRFKLISWDFAIDENNNPVLIEANFAYGGVDFHQLNNGPLFGDKTDYYLKKILYSNK